MKLNKYLLMAVMGLGLVACTENDLVEGGDSNGAQNEGTTYVAFSLDFKKAGTKAVTTEAGTASEQGITSAYVILADGDIIKEVVSSDDCEEGTGANVSKDYYLFETTEGTHQFYAVVNPDIVPTTKMTITQYFQAGVDLTVTNITAANNFMMSSCAVKEVYVADGVTKEEALAGAMDQEGTNNISINVERVSAKVTMTCGSETLDNAVGGDADSNPNYGGKISDLMFNLKGVASKAYRMAVSPWDDIPYNTWIDGAGNVEVTVGDIYSNAIPAYCLENLHSAGGYTQDNTTYITLHTIFIPKKVLKHTEAGWSLEDYNGDAATFYVVKSSTEEGLAGNYILDSDWTNYKNEEFAEGITVSAPYENGECWFGPIWIGQEADQPQQGPVYRNTWYNLAITSIKLPGEPNEPEPDDGKPLVPGTNVAVTLSVMPWNFINREIGLQ